MQGQCTAVTAGCWEEGGGGKQQQFLQELGNRVVEHPSINTEIRIIIPRKTPPTDLPNFTTGGRYSVLDCPVVLI